MSEDLGTLTATFTAEVSDLTQGMDTVEQAVSGGVKSASTSATASTDKLAAGVGRNFKLIGRSANDIGQLFGGTSQVFARSANVMAQAVDGVADVMGLIGVSSPVMLGVTAAFAALGVGLQLYNLFASKSAAVTSALAKSQSELKTQTLEAEAALTRTSAMLDVYATVLAKLLPAEELHERQQALLKTQYDKQVAVILELELARRKETDILNQQIAVVGKGSLKALAYTSVQQKVVAGIEQKIEVEKANLAKTQEGLDVEKQAIELLRQEKEARDGVADATRRQTEAAFQGDTGPTLAQGAGLDQLISEDQITGLQDRQNQVYQSFAQWVNDLQTTESDFLQATMQFGDQLAQGIGDAFAQAIVYGEDLGEAFEALGKQLLANIISFLVQLAVQEAIFAIISLFTTLGLAKGKVGASSAIAAAAAAASAFEVFGLAGFAVAPGLALAAAGVVATGAATGFGIGQAALAAEGALVTGPGAFIVGEGGQEEIIAPRSDYEKALEGGGRGEQTIAIYLDGKVITKAVVRGMPREVRLQGVRAA